MKNRKFHKIGFVALLIAVFFLTFNLMNEPGTNDQNNVLVMQPPPFLKTALAAPATQTGTSFLENEAGISAYFSTTTTINLDTVRPLYRVIEVETSDYILGSIPVANYSETQEVHAYIHKNGWILVYYGNGDPVSKIVDLYDYHNSGGSTITTKLENTLASIAATIGESFSGATYYDFRYPNATNMMIVVEGESGTGTDSFYITLPGNYSFYERSWSCGSTTTLYTTHYSLDGNTIYSDYSGWEAYGTLTASQLLPDIQHQIDISDSSYLVAESSYASLVLVYRVP